MVRPSPSRPAWLRCTPPGALDGGCHAAPRNTPCRPLCGEASCQRPLPAAPCQRCPAASPPPPPSPSPPPLPPPLAQVTSSSRSSWAARSRTTSRTTRRASPSPTRRCRPGRNFFALGLRPAAASRCGAGAAAGCLSWSHGRQPGGWSYLRIGCRSLGCWRCGWAGVLMTSLLRGGGVCLRVCMFLSLFVRRRAPRCTIHAARCLMPRYSWHSIEVGVLPAC
jgi:hypothetical protein